MLAVNNNDHVVAEALLQPQFNCNIFRYLSASLMKASELGSVELLKLLVPYKRANLRSLYNSKSCLHTAVIAKQPEAVRYLLSQGADPNLTCPSWGDMQQVVCQLNFVVFSEVNERSADPIAHGRTNGIPRRIGHSYP